MIAPMAKFIDCSVLQLAYAVIGASLSGKLNMSEAPRFDTLSPAGLRAGKMEDNASVNVDAILLSILGRGAERFGMVAAVLRGERIIAQGVAGVRKRGTAERITIDDRFHLGSCTKAMTATLVAMLVEQGKLNWTTTLANFLPRR
jgi:CubicO group peptidase (beta-lactamase class C family)